MKASKKQFNILISGASGYIGSHLINALNEFGERFFLIDRTFKKDRINIDKDFIVIESDLGKLNTDEFPGGIDILIHNAYCKNLESEKYFLSNFHKRNPNAEIVFFSSAAVYGDLINSEIENFTVTSSPDPINDYGRYKLEIEEHIKKLNPKYKILRISNPYGKEYGQIGVYQIFKNKIVTAINEDRDHIELMINYHQPYTMQRDMIRIEKAIEAIKDITLYQDHGIFNIASGRGTFLEDFAKGILEEVCVEKSLDYNKYKINFKYNPHREGEIVKSILQI